MGEIKGDSATTKFLEQQELEKLNHHAKINVKFVKRFFRLLTIMMPYPVVNQATFWLLMLTLSIITAFVYVQTLQPKYNGEFMRAVLQQDSAETLAMGFALSAIIFCQIFQAALTQLMIGALRIVWRKRVAVYMQQRYVSTRNYYYLQIQNTVDNPDERLTLDVVNFMQYFTKLLFTVFTALCWIIMSTISLAGVHWVIPTATWGFFLVMIFFLRFAMSAISKYIYRQEIREGDLRFGHIRLRTFAESVAFLNGDSQEAGLLSALLKGCIDNKKQVIYRDLALNLILSGIGQVSNFVQYVFYYILMFTPLGQSPVVFPPNMPVAEVAALMLVLQFSLANLFTNGFQALVGVDANDGASKDFADMAGYCSRIGELLELFDDQEKVDADYETQMEIKNASDSHMDDSTLALIEHVSGHTPAGDLLFEDLNLVVRRGQSVILMGPSGCGKSSLLRMISGLWRLAPEGKILKPEAIGEDGMFFLPQRSYMFCGTLRDQITYPSSSVADFTSDPSSTSELLKLLELVNLSYLPERYGGLDSENDWSTVLSLGEQQRVGMARLFYHKPAFAVLDEATSAVDTTTEEKFYSLCRHFNITFISVAHRHAVKRYHDVLLQFDRHHRFSVSKLNPDTLPALFLKSAPPSLDSLRSTTDIVPAGTRSRSSSNSTKHSANAILSNPDEETEQSSLLGGGSAAAGSSSSRPAGVPIPRRVFRSDVMLVNDNLDIEKIPNLKKLEAQSIEESTKQTDLTASEDTGDEMGNKKPKGPSSGAALNLLFFKRLVRLTKISIGSWKSLSLWLLIGSWVIQILHTLVIFQFNTTSSTLMTYLAGRNESMVTQASLELLAYAVPLYAFDNVIVFIIGMTQLFWRRDLASYIQNRYLKAKNYYKIQVTGRQVVDNADIRLTQDITDFQKYYLSILSKTMPAVLRIIIAIVMLMSISWLIPVSVIVINIIMTGIIQIPVSAIAKWTYRQEKLEGNLRFVIARMRTYAESIAFLAGERQERMQFNQKLALCIRNAKALLWRTALILNPIIYGSSLLGQYVSFIVIGMLRFVPFFDPGWSKMDEQHVYGQIGLLYGFGAMMIFNFIALSQLLGDFSTLIGLCTRIAELDEAITAEEQEPQIEYTDNMEHLSAEDKTSYDDAQKLRENELIRLVNVSCLTPARSLLFRDLSFSISKGQNVIVMGPSGCGKSSLMRLIGGLWRIPAGKILRAPELEATLQQGQNEHQNVLANRQIKLDMFFLPQKSYMFVGTLLEQIVYPGNLSAYEDRLDLAELESILDRVNLVYLLRRYNNDWNKMMDWGTVLSLGEQQRLAMARLFFHRPLFAVLDEATSAVDMDVESQFYEGCKFYNITYISVAHNESVVQYHNFMLRFEKKTTAQQASTSTQVAPVTFTFAEIAQ